jgi:hypothetical protein
MRPESSDPGVSRVIRFRQAITWACTISFLSILVIVWAWFPTNVARLLAVLALLPFLLPYAFIPFRLYSHNFRAGLSLAVAMGCSLLVPGIMLVRFALIWDRRWWMVGTFGLGVVTQSVLLVLAVRAYIPLPRARRGGTKLFASFIYGLFVFAYFCIAYSPVPGDIVTNESLAKRYLEHSAVTANLDAGEHEGLYPESVGSMGPNPNPKCPTASTDPVSTTAYIFEYRAFQSSSKSQDCGRFKAYTITAGPAVYRKTGLRSFRITNAGLEIHSTSENRPATDSDPVEYARHAPN